mgnify:CR=1 FL=1
MTVNNKSTGDKDMTYKTKTEQELIDIILESNDEEMVAAATEERERRTTQLIADFKAAGGRTRFTR